MTTFCDCTAAPPWPAMMRLHVAGVNRYYLCRRCSTIREHVCRPDGTILETLWHQATSDGLPGAVAERAREMLDRAEYEQLGLFE